jgi:hypothetical protein
VSPKLNLKVCQCSENGTICKGESSLSTAEQYAKKLAAVTTAHAYFNDAARGCSLDVSSRDPSTPVRWRHLQSLFQFTHVFSFSQTASCGVMKTIARRRVQQFYRLWSQWFYLNGTAQLPKTSTNEQSRARNGRNDGQDCDFHRSIQR